MLRKDNHPQRADRTVLILKRLREEIVLPIVRKGVVKHNSGSFVTPMYAGRLGGQLD